MLIITTLIAIVILVSLWEYCMFFYKQGLLPYAHGYNIFSFIQWLIIGIALVKVYGWIYGGIGLVFCIFLLQYLTHFSLGMVYTKTFKNDPKPALALFGIMLWITGGLTVSLFIFIP